MEGYTNDGEIFSGTRFYDPEKMEDLANKINKFSNNDIPNQMELIKKTANSVDWESDAAKELLNNFTNFLEHRTEILRRQCDILTAILRGSADSIKNSEKMIADKFNNEVVQYQRRG